MQGDKGLSLTGFRSCTTDSKDIDGRGWRREGQAGWAEDGKEKENS